MPENVKKFVYDFIDSVELLEILLRMAEDPARAWSAESLNREIRSNANSIQSRLNRLRSLGMIADRAGVGGEYLFSPVNPDWPATVQALGIEYSNRRHSVLALVFSPLKQARDLADAFKIQPKKPGKGENDG